MDFFQQQKLTLLGRFVNWFC